MKGVKSFVVAVVAFIVLALPVVLADGRLSLPTGSSTYAYIGRFPNPENDVPAMAAALRRLGFQLTTEIDAGRVELTEALRRFTPQNAAADASLLFYPAHCIEMEGVNYLVPVDARFELDVDLRFETVTLDDLLVSKVGARLRLVILDAWRKDPLARSMQRTVASRSANARQLPEPARVVAGRRDTSGLCGGGRPERNNHYASALVSHLHYLGAIPAKALKGSTVADPATVAVMQALPGLDARVVLSGTHRRPTDVAGTL